jgi:hypothetical protein
MRPMLHRSARAGPVARIPPLPTPATPQPFRVVARAGMGSSTIFPDAVPRTPSTIRHYLIYPASLSLSTIFFLNSHSAGWKALGMPGKTAEDTVNPVEDPAPGMRSRRKRQGWGRGTTYVAGVLPCRLGIIIHARHLNIFRPWDRSNTILLCFEDHGSKPRSRNVVPIPAVLFHAKSLSLPMYIGG